MIGEEDRPIGGFGQARTTAMRWVPLPLRDHEESIGQRRYVRKNEETGEDEAFYPAWDDFNDSGTLDVSFWCGADDDEASVLDLMDALAAPYTPLHTQVNYCRNSAEGKVSFMGRPVKIKDVYLPPDGHARHGQKSVCVSVRVQRHDGSDLTKQDIQDVQAAIAHGLWACRDYEVR